MRVTEADVAALKARLTAAVDDWTFDLEVPPDPDPISAGPRNPMVSPGDGKVVITWDAPDAALTIEPTGYRYGRDGSDAGGGGPWSGLLPADARSAVLDKLINGRSYTVTLAAVYPSGDVAVTTTATPVGPPPDPDPPAGVRRVPLAGLSGLGFNSIVFLAGGVTKAGMEQFGRDRGRPLDGVLTFPPRASWEDLSKTPAGELRAILGAGGLVVYSIPHAPVRKDSQDRWTTDSLAINSRGANDDYRSEQRALGALMAASGLNSERFVVRVDWEFNGDWYPWSAKHGGPETLKVAIRNCVTNLRAGGATRVRFDLCQNKWPSQSGFSTGDVMPGPEFIDVLGFDGYDQWAPSFTPEQWAVERRKGLDQTIALAKALGIQWSVDECGNTHPRDGNHGGDNPAYWEFLLATVRADAGSCGWFNTYLHPGAPATLRHDFASNPASFAAYKRLLT
jgi:hypothetical protein